jgi:hypothetical protein
VDFFVTGIKMVLVIVFCFLVDESFAGFKVLVLVVASTVSFLKYLVEKPYYNRNFNKVSLNSKPYSNLKVMSVLHGIFVWTNYLMLLGFLLGNARFNMLLYIFLLGIPIIVTLILTSRADAHMKILLTPVFKF